MLSGKGLCVGLNTSPEESYRVWLSAIVKRRQWGRPGPLGAVTPWERWETAFFCELRCHYSAANNYMYRN